ncbi:MULTISPECIES: TetR/AcrR family transcriptional regulator [unclassified Microbacterium]|uniref:TetR/AcrR family transcriptional regulator n=1 Tax=unclassified Microbacterium TaxID=2609290 RepID=UPI000EA9D301|nr:MULTISPECIES: TetR/AcrR family transcriptional regulator [unclassified Microbacterium]MBT2483800.1 TetR/AcrR family transcriptional regulator [Microbacterium sp. ISL-108]RKN66786.1 TetR/AcrR family transcriptional regulator [Microbacterium sp. CGR2]
MAQEGKAKLGRDDWARTGFEMFGESGVDAVVIERIAVRLGATKGSFYWHFRNRGELLAAVLDLWLIETEEIIDGVARIDDPRAQLRALFERAFANVSQDRSEVDLLHRADDPVVAEVLEKVSARRVAFMAEAFAATGLPERTARDRATQMYAMWLGLIRLQASLPSLMPSTPDEHRRLMRSTIGLLDDLFPDPR